MGRQARIKRERARLRAEAPNAASDAGPDAEQEAEQEVDRAPQQVAAEDGTIIHTAPLPGAEHLAGADGLFDDCEICRALRGGNTREARRLIRQESRRQAWAMRRSAN
jgi:hypothetical protein